MSRFAWRRCCRRRSAWRRFSWIRPTGLAMTLAVTAMLVGSAFVPAALAQSSEDPALVAYRSGRYEEAINAFRQRLRAGEASVDDHRALARTLRELGRYDEAEDAARDFISGNPTSPPVGSWVPSPSPLSSSREVSVSMRPSSS